MNSVTSKRETLSLSQCGTSGAFDTAMTMYSVDVDDVQEVTRFRLLRGETPILELVLTGDAGGTRWEDACCPQTVDPEHPLRWVTEPPTMVIVTLNKPSRRYESPMLWEVIDPVLKPLVVDDAAAHRQLPPKAGTATVTDVSAGAVCPYNNELNDVMSNFDHQIEENIAEKLKTTAAFARYPGWDFNGRVWWARDVGRWRCEVWCYCAPVAVVEASELSEIMAEVCERWGYD